MVVAGAVGTVIVAVVEAESSPVVSSVSDGLTDSSPGCSRCVPSCAASEHPPASQPTTVRSDVAKKRGAQPVNTRSVSDCTSSRITNLSPGARPSCQLLRKASRNRKAA